MTDHSKDGPYDMVHVRDNRNGKAGFGRFPGDANPVAMTLPLDPGCITTRGFSAEGDGGPQSKRGRARQQRANRKSIVMIDRKLNEVLVDNCDGTWSYKDQWSDKLVAAVLGATERQVHYSRLECFGPLPEPKAEPSAARALALVLNLYRLLGQELPPE